MSKPKVTKAVAAAEIQRRAINRIAKREAKRNGGKYTPIRAASDELLKFSGAELAAIASR